MFGVTQILFVKFTTFIRLLCKKVLDFDGKFRFFAKNIIKSRETNTCANSRKTAATGIFYSLRLRDKGVF